MKKKIVAALLTFTMLLNSGCYLLHGTTEAEYIAATTAQKELALKYVELQTALLTPQKLVDIPQADGKIITVYQQVNLSQMPPVPQIEQKRPSEFAGVISQGLSTLGVVGSIWAVGYNNAKISNDVSNNMGKYAGHNTSGSNNNANPVTTNTDNHQQSNMNNPVTTTTTSPAP